MKTMLSAAARRTAAAAARRTAAAAARKTGSSSSKICRACVPAVAVARKRGRQLEGREEQLRLEGRRGGEGAAELQQWRRLLQLDGRGEKSACVLLTSE